MELTRRQYNVLHAVEQGMGLPVETTPILKELEFLNLIDLQSGACPILTWLGNFSLDCYETNTTIAEHKKDTTS